MIKNLLLYKCVCVYFCFQNISIQSIKKENNPSFNQWCVQICAVLFSKAWIHFLLNLDACETIAARSRSAKPLLKPPPLLHLLVFHVSLFLPLCPQAVEPAYCASLVGKMRRMGKISHGPVLYYMPLLTALFMFFVLEPLELALHLCRMFVSL